MKIYFNSMLYLNYDVYECNVIYFFSSNSRNAVGLYAATISIHCLINFIKIDLSPHC